MICYPEDNLQPYGASPDESFSNKTYFDSLNNRYVFECTGSDHLTYSIYPDRWEVRAGYINIETLINDTVCWPIAFGGLKFRYDLGNDRKDDTTEEGKAIFSKGRYYNPIDYRLSTDVKIENISFIDDTLIIDYRDVFQGYTHTWRAAFKIKGKTLIINISGTDGNDDALGNYCGIYFDRSEGTPNPRSYILPYVVEPITLFADEYFYSVYVDRGESSASDIQVISRTHSRNSIYSSADTLNWIKMEDKVEPVNETCYLTVSTRSLDVLPSINHQASTTRWMMNDRVVIDNWNIHNFARQYNHFVMLKDYGFNNIFVILHYWQKNEYDVGLPDHYPPDEGLGGLEGFKKLADFASENNWLFTAHENYVTWTNGKSEYNMFDYYNYLVKDRHGNSDPWSTVGIHYRSISTDKMGLFAEIESSELKKNCNTSAAFLDLNAGNNPRALKQIDMNPNNNDSDTFKSCIANSKDLFKKMREIHKGPVIGEGGIGWGRYDTFYSGYLDGVDRWPERGLKVFITPEHELRIIKPLQANFGMGQHIRFFLESEYRNFYDFDYDLYRASEIAFGHSGYVQIRFHVYREGDAFLYSQFCREYYMMQQLQKRYMPEDISPLDILYWDESGWIDQDELIKKDRDFEDVLLKIRYSNGLNVWINHKDDHYIWEPEIYNGLTLQIPPNGFVALKTTGELFIACSIIIDGERVDYVSSDEYIFAENRTHKKSNIGIISTNGMAILEKNDFQMLNLHLLEGNFIANSMNNKELIRTSNRCHININYKTETEIVINVPFISFAHDLTLTYFDFPEEWRIENGKLPET